MRRLALLVALALTLGAPGVAAQDRQVNGWSERGLFVFAPGYFFDFWRAIAAPTGSHVVSRLEDCSSAQFYCFSENWFALALPRACGEIAVGDVWTVGSVTTRVIARVPVARGPHDFTAPDHAFAVATDGINAVFFYDPPFGIKSIYQGWPFRTGERAAEEAARYSPEVPARDARALAVEGRLFDEGNGFRPLTLVSPDSFGPCVEDRSND